MMTKKKSQGFGKDLILLALILAAVVIYQGIAAENPLEDLGQQSEPVLSEQYGFFEVAFTSPSVYSEEFEGIESRLISFIEEADETVDLAIYNLELESVIIALIDAEKRGVRVRVVYDNEHTDESVINTLTDEGVVAVADDRSAFMHNKFAVIDEEIVWTGSMNLTENGAYHNNNNTVLIFSREVAENYKVEFEEMYAGSFGITSPQNTPNRQVLFGESMVVTYFSPEDNAMGSLIELVENAQESVHFMAFSFTDDELGDAMLSAMERGVSVRGLFETRAANTSYSECPRLLASGADVMLDTNPRSMHHKVLIVDGSVVATGSFNFSESAEKQNDENLVIFFSEEMARSFGDEFAHLMSEAYQPGMECTMQ